MPGTETNGGACEAEFRLLCLDQKMLPIICQKWIMQLSSSWTSELLEVWTCNVFSWNIHTTYSFGEMSPLFTLFLISFWLIKYISRYCDMLKYIIAKIDSSYLYISCFHTLPEASMLLRIKMEKFLTTFCRSCTSGP